MTDFPINRRAVLGAAVGTLAATQLPAAESAKLKGNIKHSVVYWCFNSTGDKWTIQQAIDNAKKLGCVSIELVNPEHWALMHKHGLNCAIASNGAKRTGFMYGLNNPQFAPEVLDSTRATIDRCAAAKVPSVIAFVGYRWRDPANPKSGEISRDEAFKSCVANLKELAQYGEKKGVTVCVEHLNSRDSSHPMKGHPGYQGDDLDFVCEILRAVASPRVKLLFDIYHVQIMHGDLIRRLEQCRDVIGHIHTAGNPGRCELDPDQEINYPAVMKKLVSMKYAGYVGHEFIPTRDAFAGLREAVTVCDV